MPAVTRLQRSLGDWKDSCASACTRASRWHCKADARRSELRASAAHRHRGLPFTEGPRQLPVLRFARRLDRSTEQFGWDASWKRQREYREEKRRARGGFLPKDEQRLRVLAQPVNRLLFAVTTQTVTPQDGGRLAKLLKQALPLLDALARSFPFEKDTAAGSLGWDWASFKGVFDLLAADLVAGKQLGSGLAVGPVMEEIYSLFCDVSQQQEDASAASREDRYPAAHPMVAPCEDPMELTADNNTTTFLEDPMDLSSLPSSPPSSRPSSPSGDAMDLSSPPASPFEEIPAFLLDPTADEATVAGLRLMGFQRPTIDAASSSAPAPVPAPAPLPAPLLAPVPRRRGVTPFVMG